MRSFLTTRDLWNSTREFSPWFQDIDDMMDRLLIPMTTLKREAQGFNPACDVEETDSHYLMSFDLPGVSKDDVKIEVVENQLTVSGERKSEKKDDKNNRHVAERYYGSFQRVFTLPSTIDATKVEASYRDGVLQVALPKAESAKPQQIKISDGKGGIFSKLIGQKQNQVEREVKDSNKAS
jgi:HSP20 family protein